MRALSFVYRRRAPMKLAANRFTNPAVEYVWNVATTGALRGLGGVPAEVRGVRLVHVHVS